MGLTVKSTGYTVKTEDIIIRKSDEKLIALSGNPNVGKSTVFNKLTGMNQHTGNWPGKTVSGAQGRYTHNGKKFILADIPGTYSLSANSAEEEIARDFICFSKPDVTVVVVDATSLLRNLSFVLQVLEVTRKVVICLNLMDEAKNSKIEIDVDELSLMLGVPVAAVTARTGEGLDELKDLVDEVADNKRKTFHVKMTYDDLLEFAISEIERSIQKPPDEADTRWIAIQLLCGDEAIKQRIKSEYSIDDDTESVVKLQTIRLSEKGLTPDKYSDLAVSTLYMRAEEIYNICVKAPNTQLNKLRRIDRLLTSKKTGVPIMLALLCVVFWITISGANYPSSLLGAMFDFLELKLLELCEYLHTPEYITEPFVYGVFRTVGWVVSVMLPPMAIFFPMFTLLEDSGFLPRIAFNLDYFFKKAGAHGKQALTICMGFGCNVCGVIGCRIIDTPRERMIAMMTNSFIPCNGRFPVIIAVITMFFASSAAFPVNSIIGTLALVAVILLGIAMTLLCSTVMTKTILKGKPSAFSLELPPFRRPQIRSVIVRSIFDRTLFVLGRAVIAAAPAGMIIWIMSNVTAGGASLLDICADFLEPFGRLMGLDGIILMAFILGFPANEIVVPLIIMGYMSGGVLTDYDTLAQLQSLFISNGWDISTAICMIVFTLFHFPCATTCLTVYKETKSLKWTMLGFAIPLIVGIPLCMLINALFNLH